MSYARVSRDCDVYVYHDVAGGVTCCGPRLCDPVELLAHLQQHVLDGLQVPLIEILCQANADWRAYGHNWPPASEIGL